MGNVSAWIALACLVVVCAVATTIASRLAYGDSRAFGSLSPAESEVGLRRARSAGWYISTAWILSAILLFIVFWPPTAWLLGSLAGSAVLLVATLIGLDHPRTFEDDLEHMDE
jgi:hypothetical protein